MNLAEQFAEWMRSNAGLATTITHSVIVLGAVLLVALAIAALTQEYRR